MKITECGYVQITQEKNGKDYILFIPQGAQYGECYDVLHGMLQDVLALAAKSVEEAKPKGVDEAKEAPEKEGE